MQITFMQLIRAAYAAASPTQAPKVVQRMVETGKVKFQKPKEVKRLILSICSAS